MARTLSTEPNQVATPGRRTLTGWIGTKNVKTAAPASQSLARDLTIFVPPTAAATGQVGRARPGMGKGPVLLQQFVPELQSLRVPGAIELAGDGVATTDPGFLRTEVRNPVAQISPC